MGKNAIWYRVLAGLLGVVAISLYFTLLLTHNPDAENFINHAGTLLGLSSVGSLIIGESKRTRGAVEDNSPDGEALSVRMQTAIRVGIHSEMISALSGLDARISTAVGDELDRRGIKGTTE